MTNKELYLLCQEYGTEARVWKRKFMAFLPEIYKRRLYRKKGFGSIYEFAAKIGGVSQNVVRVVIRVDEKLEDFPELRSAIEKVGIHKVRLVANIVTKETESQWTEKVLTMTKLGLQTHVKDVRKMREMQKAHEVQEVREIHEMRCEKDQAAINNYQKSHPGMSIPNTPQKASFGNVGKDNNDKSDQHCEKGSSDYACEFATFTAKLDPAVIKKLKFLKANMKDGTTWNDVFKELMGMNNNENVNKSKQKVQNQNGQLRTKTRARNLKTSAEETCEVHLCTNPTTIIHHPDRYSLTKTHDRLASLCKGHHELAHRGYIDEKPDEQISRQTFGKTINQTAKQTSRQTTKQTPYKTAGQTSDKNIDPTSNQTTIRVSDQTSNKSTTPSSDQTLNQIHKEPTTKHEFKILIHPKLDSKKQHIDQKMLKYLEGT